MKKIFLELSILLTGYDNLRPEIALIYFNQLEKVYGKDFLGLLRVFESLQKDKQPIVQSFEKKIWKIPAQQAICQSIVRIWYNANLSVTVNNVTTTWVAPNEAYYEALLWKTVQAHPPALSGGYFGYWRYPPEN
jgi:hypothetical protein